MKKRRKKKISQLAICLLILYHFLPLFQPVAYAKSWTADVDQGIYTGGEEDKEEEPPEEKDMGIFEKTLVGALNGLSFPLDKVFKDLHIDLNSIIFGRVGGGGVKFSDNKVALFTFELKPGNPYGIVGSAIYASFRRIIYAILACIVFSKLAAASFSFSSAKSLNSLKEMFGNFILAVIGMTAMPYLLDVALYLRDVVLHTIGFDVAADLLGLVNNLAVTDFFRETASDSLMNALMFLGSFLLSIWFATQYVGVAMSYVIGMIAFPFICINAQFDKQALTNWLKQMLSYLLVPIIDCSLLYIPTIMGMISDSSSMRIIQLLVCTMIIPARALLRQLLGAASSMGMELAGMATMIGAGKALGSAVKNTVGAAANGAQMLSSAQEDNQMADMYDDFSRGSTESGCTQQKQAVGDLNGSSDFSQGTVRMEDANGVASAGIYENNANSNAEEPVSAQQGESIMDKYADIHNFDRPEFIKLSDARKAELYKERAKKKRATAILSTAGSIGGALMGAGLGLGSATFLSAGAKGMLSGVGMDLGGGMGRMAGNALGSFFGRTNYVRGEGGAPSHPNQLDMQRLSNMQRLENVEGLGLSGFEYPADHTGEYLQSQEAMNETADNLNFISFANANKKALLDSDKAAFREFSSPGIVPEEISNMYTNSLNVKKGASGNEQYKTFRSMAEKRMVETFKQNFSANPNLIKSGVEEIDNMAMERTIQKYGQMISNEKYTNLSRNNLELLGFKFDK